eukprot:Nk52_evm64s1073 gene=Nk52_evmTU64s1073
MISRDLATIQAKMLPPVLPNRREDYLKSAHQLAHDGANNLFLRLFHQVAHYPFEQVAIDLASLPCTRNGNKYLLVIADACTKFMILRAFPDRNATTVAGELLQVFSLFGFPKSLQSDNGREFLNETLQRLTAASNSTRLFIIPYHPRENGQAELGVRLAKDALMKAIQGRDTL